MKNNKHIIVALLALVILGVPWLITSYPQSRLLVDGVFSYLDDNYAAVFSRKSITVGQLQEKYNSISSGSPKVKILVVPGHEPNFGGTEYGALKERDLNVEVAQHLKEFLDKNNNYDVYIARNKDSWDPKIQKYFNEHWNEIVDFLKQSKSEMVHLVNNGTVSKFVDGVKHNTAPKDVATRLFGINKWVNDNNIDMAIHVHFNDYPRRNASTPGEYSGFSIYVPEKQYSNSTTTRIIADSIFKRLAKYNPVSNLPKESSGINEDQDLIAIGSYNTLNAPSMLIEYGYIYETRFNDKKVRDILLKDLAFQTYLGILDFFGEHNDASLVYDTLVLPHSWKDDVDSKVANANDVLALQTAFALEGIYPASGKTKNDCPVTGKFGPCTAEALDHFQKMHGITGEKGIVGNKTKNILNTKYSVGLR
jgi:N-acetylmuramoyl-L-alanine amidase